MLFLGCMQFISHIHVVLSFCEGYFSEGTAEIRHFINQKKISDKNGTEVYITSLGVHHVTLNKSHK